MSHVLISACDYAKIDSELIKHGIAKELIFPDVNEKYSDGLEKALRPLSNWPECPWKEFEEMRC